jgi:hypothetical protein
MPNNESWTGLLDLMPPGWVEVDKIYFASSGKGHLRFVFGDLLAPIVWAACAPSSSSEKPFSSNFEGLLSVCAIAFLKPFPEHMPTVRFTTGAGRRAR